LKVDPVILTEQVYLYRFWKVLGLGQYFVYSVTFPLVILPYCHNMQVMSGVSVAPYLKLRV